jgi:acetolactate synthase-1/2/3 large subunit
MTHTAAKILLDTLVAHGIDRAFCVPGESYLAVMDALHDDVVLDLVSCRHEGGAAWMALADAKLTGRAGVVFASRGPGASNATIAAHSAEQGAVPLVLMLGQVGTRSAGRLAMQEMDFSRTFADIAKHVEHVARPERIGEIVARAIRIAESGTPGPVVLSLPTDVLEASVEASAVARRPRSRALPGDTDVGEVARMLADARRPVLIAGGRIDTQEARRHLRTVSEAWGIPVMPTYTHQDVIDNTHDNYAGEIGIRPPDDVARTALDADLILAVGTRMGALASLGHRLPAARQRLVHVYPDETMIGRDADVSLGVVAHAGAFLAALATRNAPEVSGERAEWARTAHRRYLDFAQAPVREASDGMDLGHLVHAMAAHVPPDAVITVDAGSFASWLHLTFPFRSTQILLGSECGAMGMAVPAAVAAAIRFPERKAIAFTGDGGALMSGFEMATGMARGVRNLCVIVANNNAYGTIRMHQERHFPGRPHATDLANPDFGALAQAFGARGIVFENAADAGPALAEAMAHEGMVLVEARHSLENLDVKHTISGLRGSA